MCGSHKYPYSPHGRSMEIPRGGGGGGSQQPNCLRKSMKLNWKFQGVGGSKENTFHGGGMIIPGPHNVILSKKFHFPA